MFVVVCAAVAALIGRYAKQSAVIIEVPRTDGGDTLPLIVSLEELRTFEDLLVETQRVVASSYRYQGFPLDEIVGSSRLGIGSDVFVACGSVHRDPVPRTRHALSAVLHLGAEIAVELGSPTRAPPRWFLAQLGEQLDALLALFGEPARPLTSFDEVMQGSVLARMRALQPPPRSFAALLGGRAVGDTTVLDLFDLHVRARPDATAVITGSTSLTYAELDRAASDLAARLPIEPGEVAAVLAPRSQGAIISLLAILKARGVYLPLNPQQSEQRMQRILAEAGARVLLTHSAYIGRVREVPAIAVDLPLPDGLGRVPSAPPSAADVAYIIYTSGSTGTPKGVVIAHGGLTNTALDHIERFRVTPEDRYLQFMALSFDGFLLDTFTTLCAGAALVIASEEMIQDPSRLMDAIERHGVTMSTITPSYLQLLDPARLSSLRVLVSAGEVIPGELAACHAGRLELYNGYGPTEATINSTLHRVDPDRLRTTIPIGRPGANKRIYVVDEELQPRPIGAIGELCIAGEGLALGYLGDRALTDARFVQDPLPFEARWYRTGDLGAWTGEGELLFKGRADEQVKVNGYRIELREIENALDGHPGIHGSRVVARTVPGSGGELLAFYRPRGGVPAPDAAALRRHLADAVPEYMIPHRFFSVAEWPLGPHGKLDTAALLALSTQPAAPATAPSTGTELLLQTIWEQVLGGAVGVDDSFFSLGGDSIRVIQAVSNARQAGLHLEVRDILTHQTVRRLAAHIDRAVAPVQARGCDAGELPLQLAELTCEERAGLPPGIEDAYPAAAMQSTMIDHHDADREMDGIFLGCAEWRFEDPSLSEDALLAALQRLHDTHRCLRTSFQRARSGRDLILVRPPSPLDVRRTDLRADPPRDLDAFFLGQIARAATSRFDPWSLQPLIRWHLFRTADDRCSLFVAFHHAILDGWSGIELRNALLDHYLVARQGTPPPAAADRVDAYREFVALEQEVVRSPQAREFWRSEVASESAAACLRTFRMRTTGRGGDRGRARAAADLTPIAATALEQSCRHGVTVNAVLFSAVSRAIMHVVDVPDVFFGVVTNGRSDRLTSPLRSTGLFWNIVPVRTQPGPVERLQERLNDIARYGHFPLKEIEDSLVRGPLFLPLFNFVHFHNAGAGAERFREGVVQSRFHFPITFFVKLLASPASPASAAVTVEFDRSVFGPRDVEQMLDLILDYFR